MLVRDDVCIGQPAHAFVSGQLAANWARDPVEPFDDVVLAAAQHDVGMAEWDAAPELNPQTGRPYSFMEMPLATHLRLWAAAPGLVIAQSRWAALLVSMHGTALYEMRDLSKLSAEDAASVRDHLARQRSLQERLADGLDADLVKRNQRLIWLWDFLSLGILLGWEGRSLDGVTLREGTVEPWPFTREALTLRCDGRRLEGTFSNQAEMRAALEAAPWVELTYELARPGA